MSNYVPWMFLASLTAIRNDQIEVYEEFKEQLERRLAGRFETKLLWKVNHRTLPTNEAGRKRRLEQLKSKWPIRRVLTTV